MGTGHPDSHPDIKDDRKKQSISKVDYSTAGRYFFPEPEGNCCQGATGSEQLGSDLSLLHFPLRVKAAKVWQQSEEMPETHRETERHTTRTHEELGGRLAAGERNFGKVRPGLP